MKKFNLQKAKDRASVVTKEGKSANILYFERSSKFFPLVVLLDNMEVACYTVEGKYYRDKDSGKDLIMK